MKTERPVYAAKSANSFHGEIANREHLRQVGELARLFGREIGRAEAAGLAGDFHDFGKYAERFQGVLRGTHEGVDHALPGAAELYRRLGAKLRRGVCGEAVCAVEAVAGHHAGLTGLPQMQEDLEEMLEDDEWDACPSGKMPSLHGEAEFEQAEQAFERDFPGYQMPQLAGKPSSVRRRVEEMLDTRMLFSCLVDADYSASAMDDDPGYLEKNSSRPLDAAAMLERLEAYCARLREGSTADAGVNGLRNEVYARCGEAGEQEMGLFTLTAPTGVGKTMAMLHFALRHCARHQLQRVIVVIPYLTLAEQTEREYRSIFPEILVDHSQRSLPEEARELAQRWDSPVIITTSVRFFEGLFSDNPGACRRLHHIAGSVVLFDEAQSLPEALARPTAQAVNALCEGYRCTVVFSTATQPDFSALPGTKWQPVEILPDHARFFQQMRRVHTQWRGEAPLSRVAEEMSREHSACCIVNLRRHARTLFDLLQAQHAEEDALFFLTTDLCPAHRLKVVEEIKKRQREGRCCLVVATQCIEAGVDLDFDVMYRAMAPLEAIVQAAGRCNRNGRLPGGGRQFVFRPEEAGRLYPDASYERAASVVTNLWADSESPELSDPEQIRLYYERYFAEARGKRELEAAIERKDYAETAKRYRLIENAGVSLVVPWAGEAKLFERVRCAEQEGCVTPELLREAAPITITCYDGEAVRACAAPLMLRRGKRYVETGTFLLNAGFEGLYDPVTGFSGEGTSNKLFS